MRPTTISVKYWRLVSDLVTLATTSNTMPKSPESRLDHALSSQRESKVVEFKREFDVDSPAAWCEIVKDIVAIANSGGGVLLVALNDDGSPSGADISKLALLDPSELVSRLARYVGQVEINFELSIQEKGRTPIWAMEIEGLSIPCIFEKPGTYADDKKQKNAFSQGTSYFRHGAKSEPGTNTDISRSIERHLDRTRKRWMSGVRKVVEAPKDAELFFAKPAIRAHDIKAESDPNTVTVTLTRDRDQAEGTFLHEQVSDALFGEINNVMEANRLLFPGRNRFLLGQAAYYRVYAERHHVEAVTEEIEKLIGTAIAEYYPLLFWFSMLASEKVAEHLSNIYLKPKGNEVSILLRIAALLGPDFCELLRTRFEQRWRRYSQPPGWYHRCMALASDSKTGNPFALATGSGLQSTINGPEMKTVTVSHLLANQAECDELLTRTCLAIFSGDANWRSQSRILDVLCQGHPLISRRDDITQAFSSLIGDRLPEREA
jgi:hypothetical protein